MAGAPLVDHSVCSGRSIAPYTEPNVTEHDVMDVYGSTSLTAWTVISTEQGKSAARVKTILKGARMFTRFRDTDFVRRSHCVNGVLRTVLKGCKTALKEQNTIIKNQMVRKRYRLRGKRRFTIKSNLTIRIILAKTI